MDFLLEVLGQFFDDPQHIEWMVYALAGVAGITLAVSISYFISGVYSPVKKRLKSMNDTESHSLRKSEQDVNNTLEHSIGEMAKKPFFNTSNNQTKRLLIHAGFHSENALAIFNAARLILFLLAAVLSVIILNAFPKITGIWLIYVICLCMGGAFILPSMILQSFANRRMKSLRVGFPDALDLLVVCCEAGLGLMAAMQRVAKELSFSHPALASELELVCAKVRAGLTVKVALHEFTERTGLEDTKGLNSAITQSMRLGTGIAETLRVFSDEYRDKRLQAAEEQAAKLAVKMIFPMMCCIWPSFFIVAVGPAILKVMKVWGQAF